MLRSPPTGARLRSPPATRRRAACRCSGRSGQRRDQRRPARVRVGGESVAARAAPRSPASSGCGRSSRRTRRSTRPATTGRSPASTRSTAIRSPDRSPPSPSTRACRRQALSAPSLGCTDGRGLDSPYRMTISPDHRNLYLDRAGGRHARVPGHVVDGGERPSVGAVRLPGLGRRRGIGQRVRGGPGLSSPIAATGLARRAPGLRDLDELQQRWRGRRVHARHRLGSADHAAAGLHRLGGDDLLGLGGRAAPSPGSRAAGRRRRSGRRARGHHRRRAGVPRGADGSSPRSPARSGRPVRRCRHHDGRRARHAGAGVQRCQRRRTDPRGRDRAAQWPRRARRGRDHLHTTTPASSAPTRSRSPPATARSRRRPPRPR